jgi:hypothetical protein
MIRRILLAAAIALAIPAEVQARDSSAAGAPTRPVEATAAFSKKVERALAERGARVAIVARMGREPETMPPGFAYTHVGIWVHASVGLEGGAANGYAVYNLYQRDDEPDVSDLKQDFPFDFFATAVRMQSAAIVPIPEVEERLLRVLASPTYAKLHNPRYSAVANPNREFYQNCTSFVLDVLNAAIYDTDNIGVIKANIAAYFEPQPVAVGPLKRLAASLFVPGVATTDHGDTIATATFETIARYMQRYRLADAVIEVSAD